MPCMTRHALLLAFFGLLLLTPSCRHRGANAPASRPHFSHEEAEPVSNLPHDDFSQVYPHRCDERCPAR